MPSALLLPTSPDFLRLQGRRRTASGGLIHAGQRVSYPQLSTAVDDLATWLAHRGIGAGHHVAVMAGNGPAFVAMMYAVWGTGAVAVPIGVRSTTEEAARLLIHSRSVVLLCDTARAASAQESAATAGIPSYACEAIPM